MPKQDIQNTVLCCQKTLSVGSFTRHPNNTACCKWSEENVFPWIFLKAVVSTQHCLLHVLQFLPLLKSQSDFPLPYIIQSCLKRTARHVCTQCINRMETITELSTSSHFTMTERLSLLVLVNLCLSLTLQLLCRLTLLHTVWGLFHHSLFPSSKAVQSQRREWHNILDSLWNCF